MARNPIRRLPPTGGRTSVQKMEMETFARRLHKLMLDKEMSASELASQIWGRTTDKRGHDVARGRDRISVYLKGTSFPDPINLAKIAKALGTTAEELAPDAAAAAVERENPELAMTAVSGHADKVFLRVNKLVPLHIAAKVIAMISDAEGQQKG